jgi:hypothetical protein
MDRFDIFSYICNFLKDIDKIHLTTTSNIMNQFKNKLLFTGYISEKRIRDLPFFDNFRYVKIDCTCIRVPKNIKKLFVKCSLECTHESVPLNFDTLSIIRLSWFQVSIRNPPKHTCDRNMVIFSQCYIFQRVIIPNTVAKLMFGRYFNQPVNYIPRSVTHLTFGESFNQVVSKIPNSVTHLYFGVSFNQSIEGLIPNSVIHLEFGYSFNKLIPGQIPNSVTHLSFECPLISFPEDCIPQSVTHLTMHNPYKNLNLLRTSVTHIKNTYNREYVKVDRLLNGLSDIADF